MATLVYELGKPKKDGSRRIAILLSHNGRRKRFPTNIIVGKNDISRKGKITSLSIQKTVGINACLTGQVLQSCPLVIKNYKRRIKRTTTFQRLHAFSFLICYLLYSIYLPAIPCHSHRYSCQ